MYLRPSGIRLLMFHIIQSITACTNKLSMKSRKKGGLAKILAFETLHHYAALAKIK